jgi:hypothetical protein
LLLKPHLTRDNCAEMLDLARHKTKREIEAMLADRAPKPDVPATVRFVREPVAPPASAPAPAVSASPAPPAPPVAIPRAPAVERPAPAPEPLGTGRYRVEFTAPRERHAKLAEAQALLRHQIPDGDLARVFDHRASEITLRCRAHNQHAALQDYGAQHMARFRPARSATAPGGSSLRRTDPSGESTQLRSP